MIASKEDLKYYWECDRIALRQERKHPRRFLGVLGVPQLGDNIFLAEGCKLIGNITVADNVQIGANAVVVKSIEEPGTTWGGIPAGKISDKSSANNLIRATELVKR